MTFKDKLIKNISCRRFYSPTQLEYPSFGELETYQWGECTAAVDISGFLCYFCVAKMLSLHTIELLPIRLVR